MEMLRAILYDTKLPLKLWATLTENCNDIINKMRNSSTKVIPWEAMHDKIFDNNELRKMKILGSKVYYLHQESGKLSKNSRLGWYLGPKLDSVDGVVNIYNGTTNRVIATRNFKVMNGDLFENDFKVGNKIDVYHSDDQWYEGMVTEIRTVKEGTKLFVKFDDGDEDIINYNPNEVRHTTLNSECFTTVINDIPNTVNEAMHIEGWREAMLTEWLAVKNNNTFEAVYGNVKPHYYYYNY